MLRYLVKRRKNIPIKNTIITIVCASLYEDVESKILPIIHGAKNVDQIPKNDNAPQIVLNDFNPKHSVTFKEIKAPKPPKPIPKTITPHHIPKILPCATSIIIKPID